ncbi:MAG: peptidoglycan DD-metalloendopeptidase family protein [Chloroflexi bacterium]|jgi:murein DD-endopeptidase MepM/ murein hydrolase activator NlpD|nr:peptidoglycan DD-metalloendopeptidase family protein [Chloroflexota bacterium]
MTTSTYPGEDEWDSDEWIPTAVYADYEYMDHSGPPVDMVLVAMAILVAAGLVWGALALLSDPIVTLPPMAIPAQDDAETQPLAPPLPVGDPAAIIAPYDEYIITQGVHGLSYGHMAIDIAAGKGEPIKSPINGVVTEHYFDAIGNPTLVIENENYQVTILHGIYSVGLGSELNIGDQIGTEGNLGNTRDMQGRSCRGRDCGYHTHLNVFDKRAGANINPLELLAE